jgi:CRISPR-associated protein Csx10
VPGSVWRGAVARTVLEQLGRRNHSGRSGPIEAPPADFIRIFGGAAPAQFGFLYPASTGADSPTHISALPVPLTARTCKTASGFQPSGHGVFDGLLHRIRVETQSLVRRPHLESCPHCRGRLDRMRGFASRYTPPQALSARLEQAYASEKPIKRSYVRVGLNRLTETAQDRFLYVLDALTPVFKDGSEQRILLVGRWQGDQVQLDLLRQFLDQHLVQDEDGWYLLRIGAARARGFGAARIRFAEADPTDGSSRRAALEDRLQSFQAALYKERDEVDGHPWLYASLTLHTPLHLVDEQGLPATALTPQVFRAYLPATPTTLEVLPQASVVEQEQRDGWSAAWGLPKPVTPALGAGSVLVVRAAQSERQAFVDFLTALEQQGLGERRAEGWGALTVCDPFHLQLDESTFVKP